MQQTHTKGREEDALNPDLKCIQSDTQVRVGDERIKNYSIKQEE